MGRPHGKRFPSHPLLERAQTDRHLTFRPHSIDLTPTSLQLLHETRQQIAPGKGRLDWHANTGPAWLHGSTFAAQPSSPIQPLDGHLQRGQRREDHPQHGQPQHGQPKHDQQQHDQPQPEREQSHCGHQLKLQNSGNMPLKLQPPVSKPSAEHNTPRSSLCKQTGDSQHGSHKKKGSLFPCDTPAGQQCSSRSTLSLLDDAGESSDGPLHYHVRGLGGVPTSQLGREGSSMFSSSLYAVPEGYPSNSLHDGMLQQPGCDNALNDSKLSSNAGGKSDGKKSLYAKQKAVTRSSSMLEYSTSNRCNSSIASNTMPALSNASSSSMYNNSKFADSKSADSMHVAGTAGQGIATKRSLGDSRTALGPARTDCALSIITGRARPAESRADAAALLDRAALHQGSHKLYTKGEYVYRVGSGSKVS